MPGTRVGLESGARRVFAFALDWPGWCRSGRNEEEALAALAAYAPRYAEVAAEAGLDFPTQPDLAVAERLAGDATTDFGAPGQVAAADREPLSAAGADRLADLLEAAWRVFDRTVQGAPAELRKGPRGGGRDRDAIAAHVRDAEGAYERRLGLRRAGREDLLGAIRAGRDGRPPVAGGWPVRYAARRIAWHALDHAWEIEDRSSPG